MTHVCFITPDTEKDGTLAGFATYTDGTLSWLGALSAHASLLDRAAQATRFQAKAGQTCSAIPLDGGLTRLLGLAHAGELTALAAQKLGAAAYAAAETGGSETLYIDAAGVSDSAPMAAHMAAGALMRAYRFDPYRTELKPEDTPAITQICVITPDPQAAQTAFDEAKAVVDGMNHTRDLTSQPPNILYPESFAEDVAKLAELGLEISIMDQAELEQRGFGALLGVAQGSVRAPRVAIMQWRGAEGAPVAFVGKGVTFDTGGISIKPAAGMEDMKWDMGGAGIVTGVMHTLAARKAKVHAVGILGLVENMPDGNAQRPGDIVTSLSGKTIEVLNTDAEGRLVLADILWHVQEAYKPKAIIDLATLTGAMLVALGFEKAGLFAKDDALANALLAAGEASGDAVWRMPLGQEYNKQLNSQVADMRNIGAGRWAGSITAACFLERFIQNDTPWAHLDVAGVVWSDSPRPFSRKGATGWGVRLLDQWVRDTQENT